MLGVVCAHRHGFVCLLVLASWATPAHAFECKRSDKFDFISLRWKERVIPYYVQRGAAELSHIEAAFGSWSANDCTDITFEYAGEVNGDEPDINKVVFIRENWGAPADRDEGRPLDAVAVTLTTYTRDDGEIQSAVIEVNEERFLFAEVTESCSEPDTYDLIAVITHEVGHFIGLDHTASFMNVPGDPTMAPRVGECEADKRTLESDDIDALCLIYPRGQPARSCDALPTESNYVSNRIFGCSAIGEGRGDAASWLTIAAILLFSRRRRGQNLR
jgi:hypothetical protein